MCFVTFETRLFEAETNYGILDTVSRWRTIIRSTNVEMIAKLTAYIAQIPDPIQRARIELEIGPVGDRYNEYNHPFPLPTPPNQAAFPPLPVLNQPGYVPGAQQRQDMEYQTLLHSYQSTITNIRTQQIANRGIYDWKLIGMQGFSDAARDLDLIIDNNVVDYADRNHRGDTRKYKADEDGLNEFWALVCGRSRLAIVACGGQKNRTLPKLRTMLMVGIQNWIVSE